MDELLKLGILAHRSGKFTDADRHYTKVLEENPNHPDANHNLGVLACDLGKFNLANKFFFKAISINPKIEQFWISYIKNLIKTEHYSNALTNIREAQKNGIESKVLKNLEQELNNKKKLLAKTNKKNISTNSSLQKRLKIAEAKIQSAEQDEARKIFNEILAKFPKNKRAKAGLKLLNTDLEQKYKTDQNPKSAVIENIISLFNRGKNFDTLKYTVELLKSYPNSPILYNLYGAASSNIGNFKEAIKSFERAVELRPNYAEAYNNLGNLYRRKGQSDMAKKNYMHALAINPSYSEALNNMGVIFHNSGDLKSAKKYYSKALELNAKYPDALLNFGLLLQMSGNPNEAIIHFQTALEIKPKFSEAYINMGIAYENLGDLSKALNCFKAALRIDPSRKEALINFADLIQNTRFSKHDPEMHSFIRSIFSSGNFVRPINISKAIISLLKNEPQIKELLEVLKNRSPLDISRCIDVLADIPLLMEFMLISPIPDLEIECLLLEIRSYFLDVISTTELTHKKIVFLAHLAVHCFTNEYVYHESDEQQQQIKELQAKINSISDHENIDFVETMCLAAFRVIHSYSWVDKVVYPKELSFFPKRLIVEPKLESNLIGTISKLKKINKKVSNKVRIQYENNPYPRWVKTGLQHNPHSVSQFVKQLGIEANITELDKVLSPRILIAGCGTGQHSIETASRFKNCKITAIDLSLASLTYAKRKTIEVGLENIEYLHGDILDLDTLKKEFHIVESSGVIHHMKNPIEGWEILARRLVPGGLMKIGLYSELARTNIAQVKNKISRGDQWVSDTYIKNIRHKLKASDEETKKIFRLNDMYSLSEVRDLVFHVQEHVFSIPKIEKILKDLGFHFCGFENKILNYAFKQKHKDPKDLLDLEKWHEFELENPSIFIGMYQFWCQKTL